MMGDKEYQFWLDWKKRQEQESLPQLPTPQKKLTSQPSPNNSSLPQRPLKPKKTPTVRTVYITHCDKTPEQHKAFLEKDRKRQEARLAEIQRQQSERERQHQIAQARKEERQRIEEQQRKEREKRREHERQRRERQILAEAIRLAPIRAEDAQKEKVRKEKEFFEEQERRKKEAELAEERRNIERLKFTAQSLSPSASSQISEAERQKLENRKKVVAQKLASGIPQVERRRVVTLLNIESDEQLRFYFVQSEYYDKDKRPAGLDEDIIPQLHSDIEVLRSGSPMGKLVSGLFIGEEFRFKGSENNIAYRIINVGALKECDIAISVPQIFPSNNSERSIYSGRGQTEVGENNTLDGSKYIGYMARDGGQWGSFPSHDDYGDESDAEGSDYNDFADI